MFGDAVSGGVAAAVAVDGGFSLVRGSWRLFIILVFTFSGILVPGGAATPGERRRPGLILHRFVGRAG